MGSTVDMQETSASCSRVAVDVTVEVLAVTVGGCDAV